MIAHKPKILVVEDESLIAKHIQLNLEQAGYEVVGIASSGPEALELSKKLRPDLVMMDIILKGKQDGIEAANEIKSRYGAAIIFLTSHADENTLERAKRVEPAGYILKPFDERELNAAVKMALYKQRQERLTLTKNWLSNSLCNLDEAVIAIDAHFHIIFANSSAETLLDLPPQDTKGKPLAQLLKAANQNEKDALEEYIRKMFLQESKTNEETPPVSIKIGEKNEPFYVFGSIINDSKGNILVAALVFYSKLKLQKQNISQPHKNRNSNISENNVILILSESGNIVSFNEAAGRVFGYQADEVLGKHFSILTPKSFQIGMRKDGSTFSMDMAVSRIRFGERSKFIGLMHDIHFDKETGPET